MADKISEAAAQSKGGTASTSKGRVQQESLRSSRYWEIDCLRGLSIVAMVIYHEIWNLSFFGLVDWYIPGPGFQAAARSIGTSFLTIVGISLYISFHRRQLAGQDPRRRLALRGLKLLLWAAVVTSVTVFFLDNPVYFGILHLISAASLLSIPVLPSPKIAGILGLLILVCDFAAPPLNAASPWLLPLGVARVRYAMADYYPLVPWLGVVYIGIYVGSLAYPLAARRAGVRMQPDSYAVSTLVALGRRSLVIYLAHQPILLALTLLIREAIK